MVAQAREYLEKQGYAPPDTQGGRATLSYSLLLLLHCTPQNVLPKGIRAISMLLQHEEAGQSADTIVAAIMHKLDAMLKHMVHMANVVQEAVNDTRKATDHLYRTGEEMRDELQKGMEAVRKTYKELQMSSEMRSAN